MNFSSLLFIFFFLPIFYLLFILLPKSKRYIVLIIFNLIFYLYSGIFNFCLLIFTILFNYFYIKLLGKKYQRSYNVLVIINILIIIK
jgi:alginate O-acetyltransferase complex protein AlgI